jgi:hypothetical protein
MTKSAWSVLIYSFYILGMGFTFLFIPNFALSLLGLANTSEPWIRVLGLFSIVVGVYYCSNAVFNLTDFFRISIVGRVLFWLGMIGLWLSSFSPVLGLVGCVDLFGAIWTAWAMWSEGGLF